MGDTVFIHLTDLHVGNPAVPDDHLFSDTSATLVRVLDLIGTMDVKPQFIIASGDLTNKGDADSFRNLKSIMSKTDLPVVYALGNHDTRPGFYEGMLGQSTDLDAPYDHDQVIAGVHIITLDTTTPGQIGGLLVISRRGRIVVERVIDAVIDEDLEILAISLELVAEYDVGIVEAERKRILC